MKLTLINACAKAGAWLQRRSKTIVLAAVCFTSLQTLAQKVKEFNIYFESDVHVLSDESKQMIDRSIAELTNTYKAYKVEIIGHTDTDGDLNYNQALSKRRAKKTKEYLVGKGFLGGKVTTKAKNFSDPMTTNATDAGKSRNRRVSVAISVDVPKIDNIAGVTLDTQKEYIDPITGARIQHPSGSVVYVPENAFEDKDGNLPNGKVRLEYTEYRDPIDFILGGIPMDVDHHGESSPFNSAGMFQINAFDASNNPLSLRQGSNIDVDFALVDEIPNTNFYAFDTSKQQWSELATISDANGQPGDIKQYNMTCGSLFGMQVCHLNGCLKMVSTVEVGRKYAQSDFDLSTLLDSNAYLIAQQRLAAMDVDYEQALTEYNKILDIMRKYWSKHDSLQQLLHQQKRLYTVTDVVVKGKKVRFKLAANPAAKGLAHYNDVVWKYKSYKKMDAKQFEGGYDTMKIVKMRDDKYMLVGRQAAISKRFKKWRNVEPMLDVSRKERAAKKTELYDLYSRDYASVDQEIARIKDQIDENYTIIYGYQPEYDSLYNIINAYNDVQISAYRDSLHCFWTANDQYMSETEKNMDFKAWVGHFDTHREEMVVRYDSIENNTEGYTVCKKEADAYVKQVLYRKKIRENQQKAFQALSITGMGIFNCDQISRLTDPQTIMAKYEDGHGNEIEAVSIYLIDPNINGVITYNGYRGLSPYKFAFSHGSDTKVLMFDANANPYVIPSKQFKRIPKSTDNVVLMASRLDLVKDKKELNKLLAGN